jgi:hypothetical protein
MSRCNGARAEHREKRAIRFGAPPIESPLKKLAAANFPHPPKLAVWLTGVKDKALAGIGES